MWLPKWRRNQKQSHTLPLLWRNAERKKKEKADCLKTSRGFRGNGVYCIGGKRLLLKRVVQVLVEWKRLPWGVRVEELMGWVLLGWCGGGRCSAGPEAARQRRGQRIRVTTVVLICSSRQPNQHTTTDTRTHSYAVNSDRKEKQVNVKKSNCSPVKTFNQQHLCFLRPHPS